MQSTRNTLLAALLAAVAVAPAMAGNGNGHGNGHGKGGKHADNEVVEIHRDRHDDWRDRDHRVYDERHDRRNAGCPPGLAKKHNGCLPPGQAKKLAVGHPVPAGAIYTIPTRVRTQLPPPPAGYRYAIVNNQVVLVSRGNLIADIVLNLLG